MSQKTAKALRRHAAEQIKAHNLPSAYYRFAKKQYKKVPRNERGKTLESL